MTYRFTSAWRKFTFANFAVLNVDQFSVSDEVIFGVIDLLGDDAVGVPGIQDILCHLAFDLPSFHDVRDRSA
jgi:hypothetical protein